MFVRARTNRGCLVGRVAQCLGTFVVAAMCVGIILLGFGAVPKDTVHDEDQDIASSIPTVASISPPSHFTLGPEAESYVRQLVLNTLRDPVGRCDFALQAAGAKVLSYLTSSPPVSDKHLHGGAMARAGPNAALRDDLRLGECWRIAGASAQLGVGIPELIHVTHVTINHIPIELASDIGEAPRKMFLWGVIDGPLNHALYRNWTEDGPALHPPGLGRIGPPMSRNHLYVLLATFEYDINAPFYVQTFQVDPSVSSKFYFGMFVLEIVDNWGGESTCLYRLRIHGSKALM